MKPLFTKQEYEQASDKDTLLLECENCNSRFNKKKVDVRNIFNPNKRDTGDCCSHKCVSEYKIKKS